MCLLMMLLLYYFYDKKFKLYYLLYFMIPPIIVLMSGSRTYFVSLMITLVLLYQFKLKQHKFRFLIVPLILVLIIYAILNSNVFERFFMMGNNHYISENFWEAASSGRLIWWKIDLDIFSNLNFINQFFGMGYPYVYDINLIYYGLRISAHNDFINILISLGYFGLVAYILILGRVFYQLKKITRKKGNIKLYMPVLILLLYVIMECNY